MVSDLAGHELRRQASQSSKPQTLVKGSFKLPKYHDIQPLILSLHFCRVPASGKRRLQQPEDVEETPFQNFLLHFFKTDSQCQCTKRTLSRVSVTDLNPCGCIAPSPAQLRRESTAIDRILTQTFDVSLLHIRADSNGALAHTARQSRALVPRQREVTSSEPDLFPSVSSISPRGSNQGDAEVFLDSCSGKGKANKRMSTQFVQKLLGHSPSNDEDLPSSPPSRLLTSEHSSQNDEESQCSEGGEGDEVGESEDETRRWDGVPAVSFLTSLLLFEELSSDKMAKDIVGQTSRVGEAVSQTAQQHPGMWTADEEEWEAQDYPVGSETQERPSTVNSFAMDNSLAQSESEQSCTSPPEEHRVPIKSGILTTTGQTAQTVAPVNSTHQVSGCIGNLDRSSIIDLLSAYRFIFPTCCAAATSTEDQVKDALFKTDTQVHVAYTLKRIEVMRRQAQQYDKEGPQARAQQDVLKSADAMELDLIDYQRARLVAIRSEAQLQLKRSLDADKSTDVSGPPTKRIRM